MPVNYPKFDKKIQEQIDDSSIRGSKTRRGTIVSYNKYKNTAKVMAESRNTSGFGNVFLDVPCPGVGNGIQQSSPEPGMQCIIGFEDVNESLPYIVSIMNSKRFDPGIASTTYIQTGIPKFMVK